MMLPVSQFWHLLIVMPAAENVLSLETKDAIHGGWERLSGVCL